MPFLLKMLLGLVVWSGLLGLAMYCRNRNKLTGVLIVVGFIILFLWGLFGTC